MSAPSPSTDPPKVTKASFLPSFKWIGLSTLVVILSITMAVFVDQHNLTHHKDVKSVIDHLSFHAQSVWAAIRPHSSHAPVFSDWDARLQSLQSVVKVGDEKFKIEWDPISANESTVLIPKHARLQFFDAQTVRLEVCLIAESCVFEDQPSRVFWFRHHLPSPALTITYSSSSPIYEIFDEEGSKQDSLDEKECFVVVETDRITVVVDRCREHYSNKVQVVYKENGAKWALGDEFPDDNNLKGTCRTLDRFNGRAQLENGLISRDGFTVIEDSTSFLFNTTNGWFYERPASTFSKTHRTLYPVLDLYYFGYGTDYQLALNNFIKLSGKTPLIPRFSLGTWWSRWWEYTERELRQLVTDFKQKDYPLSILVIDMDWHTVKTGDPRNEGWTGYSWNRDLFPDPKAFLQWVHEQGLYVTLNLHPASGCWPHEESYQAFAEYMGVNPEKKTPIEFDCTDEKFMRGYFDFLHRPHEDIGIDFWWIDWQHGSHSAVANADPLFILNHYHALDRACDQSQRPFVFSRWPGLGGHRYPIGFSGDTYVSWDSLQFQPYHTATSANVAFGWWSHDLGGFMDGKEDPELYTRWLQFGAFSPIFRIHSIKTPWSDRRPWVWDDLNLQKNVRDVFYMRHRLVPYLYSMSWRNFLLNIPLVRPMYHDHPSDPVSYCTHNQYFFGSELLVAPFLKPKTPSTDLSRTVVWFPSSRIIRNDLDTLLAKTQPVRHWYHFFTGEKFHSGKAIPFFGDLSTIPVFAAEGAIVPLATEHHIRSSNINSTPQSLDVHVFVGADGHFDLYEDDGVSNDYNRSPVGGSASAFCVTRFEQTTFSSVVGSEIAFHLHPVQGNISFIPQQRSFNVHLVGVSANLPFEIRVNNQTLSHVSSSYDPLRKSLVFSSISIAPTDHLSIIIRGTSLTSPPDRTRSFVQLLRGLHLNTYAKAFLEENLKEVTLEAFWNLLQVILKARPSLLNSFDEPICKVLLEYLSESGIEVIDTTTDDAKVLLFNPHKSSRVHYSFDDSPAEIIPELKCLAGSSVASKVLHYSYISSLHFNQTIRATSPPSGPLF